ncbi:hypothetical protein SAMN05192544_11429, partial [Paraburkholderia hospita]
MNVVNGRIRRNDPKRVVMFRHAELAHSGAVSPDADIKAARPARGRRLALWVASASALAVVVTCIVAYGDRFDHEQAPGIVGPTSPAQSTSWSGHVALPSSPPARGNAVASVELAPPVSSAPSDHRAGSTPDSAAPQSVTRGHAETRDAATQNRRHSAPRVRAIARHAPEITRSTSPTLQASSSGHAATSSSPRARETAIGSVGLAPPVPSASFDHRSAPSPNSASSQLAEGHLAGGHGVGSGAGGSGAGGSGAGGSGTGGLGAGSSGAGGSGTGGLGAGSSGAGSSGVGSSGVGSSGAGGHGAGGPGAGSSGAGGHGAGGSGAGGAGAGGAGAGGAGAGGAGAGGAGAGGAGAGGAGAGGAG